MHYSLYFCPIMNSDFSLSMGAAFVCNNKIRGGRSSRCNSDYAFPPFVFLSLFHHLHCIGMQSTSSEPIYGAHAIYDKMHRGWRKRSSGRSCIEVQPSTMDVFPSPASFLRFRWATLRNCDREVKKNVGKSTKFVTFVSQRAVTMPITGPPSLLHLGEMQFIVSLYRRERATWSSTWCDTLR